MKRYLSLLFFCFCFSLGSLLGQTVIWEENFDGQVGKGVWGDGAGGEIVDLTGVNWTLDYSNCSFSNDEDFIKVDSYFSKGRFEARDCDGEAVWESEDINISGFSNVSITAKLAETGSSSNPNKKYIRIYSIVDGTEYPFDLNSEGLGNFSSLQASTTITSGTSLKIRVRLRSDYAQDVCFDDIKVTGTPGAPSGNDTDSEIAVPDTQVADQTLVAVTANQTESEVFKFKITDKGTADTKPTKPTKIILKKAGQNTLDWANKILRLLKNLP